MEVAESKGHKTDRMMFYCPLKLYFFPNCTEKDFSEIEDLDEQYVWDEVELKEWHSAWQAPLYRLMNDIEGSGGKTLAFIDEPMDARYDRFKDIISGNTLSLKVVGDQAWLAVDYKFKKAIAPEDIPLLKEYAAEQFIIFDSFYFGGRGVVPCQSGIFAVTANAADYYSGPNSYNLEENHLLSEQEMPDGGEMQISPLSL